MVSDRDLTLPTTIDREPPSFRTFWPKRVKETDVQVGLALFNVKWKCLSRLLELVELFYSRLLYG